MKKIVFVINNLEVGGVQTSLLNLINEIHTFYDITVLSFYADESYKSKLPDDVKLVSLKFPLRHLGLSSKDVKSSFRYFTRAVFVILTKLIGRSRVIKLMSLFQKRLSGFDYAISYLHEAPPKNFYGGCNEFVLNKIDATHKIAWLHCDFALNGADYEKSYRIYSRFDKIIACSEGVKKTFLSCIPKLNGKTVSLRNCNNYRKIEAGAENPIKYDKNYFNVLTVSRLSEEKGIERMLYATRFCLDKGCKLKYHIVGSGGREGFLKEKAKELRIEDNVVFYGNKVNPYPYFCNADLFVLPSYHEAAPMVFDEASYLGVPILATETTSTTEMILDNGFGFVCENSQDALSTSLYDVISDAKKLSLIKDRMKNTSFNNLKIVEDFKKILSEESATAKETER